jgi:hypothetical protein
MHIFIFKKYAEKRLKKALSYLQKDTLESA